mgnify:CR=1 FL=1
MRPTPLSLITFAALSLSGTALGQVNPRPWLVWERLVPPPSSRTDWIAIAQDYPGYPWVLRAASGRFDTFAEAAVAADAVRVSPAFTGVCDRSWELYSNAQGARSVSRDPPPGGGFTLERGGLCCEEAFNQAFPGPAGDDCRSMRLLSDPSVVVAPSVPAGAASPAVAPAPGPGVLPSLSGAWHAGRSSANITHTGSAISGTFVGREGSLDDSTGSFTGRVSGASVTGSWSAKSSGYAVSGSFTMTASPDGKRLGGSWRTSQGDTETITWTR